MNQIQHGDVLITKVRHLPEGATAAKRKNGRLIVAEGEATGHHHAIADKGATIWMLTKNGVEQIFLEVTAGQVTISHEEHKPIEIPRGVYEIGTVKEYDYFQEMERNVID